MIRGSVARRYAKALMQVAQKADQVDAIAGELDVMAPFFAHGSELMGVMKNPAFGLADRRKVLVAVGEKARLGPNLRRFLELLLERERIDAMPGIARAFQEMADQVAGRVRAEVVSAEPLGAAYRRRLVEVLEKSTARKVLLTEKVDPTLLGGMVTTLGDKRFDGSLKNRLERIRATLVH
jgi:F-type H+-transporting ATPase subunit delta